MRERKTIDIPDAENMADMEAHNGSPISKKKGHTSLPW